MSREWCVRVLGAVAAGALIGAISPGAASAQSVADFYINKQISVIIGSTPGGGFDTYARFLTRHMHKHIPGNPRFVNRNLPAAASMAAARTMSTSDNDGTVMGAFNRALVLDIVMRNMTNEVDPRTFGWLGSLNNEINVFIEWHTGPVASFEEIFTKELIVAGSGAGTDSVVYARVINEFLGGKLKIVQGYESTGIGLAMERGEVHGRVGIPWTNLKSQNADWLRDKKIRILAQLSADKHADLPDVPLVTDYVKSDEGRQVLALLYSRQEMGRPFAMPAGVPADPLAALRKAFMDTTRDPDFISEGEKANLDFDPIDGERVQQIVNNVYAASPDLLKRLSEIVYAK
jgi:tripartite-type tricarboxylate transporter receptor subunit TctC